MGPLHPEESQVAVAVLGPGRCEGGAGGECRPQVPYLLFFISQMKAVFRFRSFLMSCHHGDGIGNSFSETLLLNHLSNYLHTMTPGGPESCVLPSL